MTLYWSQGGPDAVIGPEELDAAVRTVLDRLGSRERVVAVPPDHTRGNSRAGAITGSVYRHYGAALRDVLPALGTHAPMTDAQLAQMFPDVPRSLFRVHDWRHDVVTVGTIPGDEVAAATHGIWSEPWPCQLNRLLWEGGHDLILSIGQVVPHEVVGMANYTKNLFVGTGGVRGIDASHFIGAAYGMERMMGRTDTPVRRLLDTGYARFCRHLPIVFVLTVIGTDPETGGTVTRGLFVGDDQDCFAAAADLSRAVNLELLDEEPHTVVCSLDPDEFHSTWLGNKAIYRTRMAIADGGELVILGPGVASFGEDPGIDALIRRHGYRGTPAIMRAVRDDPELAGNLSAAAHLIHGSSEGRFGVTWCPGGLSREEIEGVGYRYADCAEMQDRYRVAGLRAGWNEVDGERLWYIPNPALGLWAARQRFASGGD